MWPDIVWSKTSSIITHQCIAIGSAMNAWSCRQLNFFFLVLPTTVRGPFRVIRVPLDSALFVSVSHRVQIAFGKRPVPVFVRLRVTHIISKIEMPLSLSSFYNWVGAPLSLVKYYPKENQRYTRIKGWYIENERKIREDTKRRVYIMCV